MEAKDCSDSGGPLVCTKYGRTKLYGISSRQLPGHCGDVPEIFSSVKTVREWIAGIANIYPG